MTFSEFLKTITKGEVTTWWNTIAPNEAPEKAEEDNWKYKLSKNGKTLPFKYTVKELAKYANIDFKDFASNVANRDAFCDAFDFAIVEDLVYDNTEAQSFISFYKSLKQTSATFQEATDYLSTIITHNKINPYKIRMALRENKKQAMLVIGMRAVFALKEENEKAKIAMILDKETYENSKSKLDVKLEETFNGKPAGKVLITFEINDWNEIPQEILENHTQELLLQYHTIKDTKRATWNTESNTTNSVLKYLIFKRQNIAEFIRNNDVTPIRYSKEYFKEKEFVLLHETNGKLCNRSIPEFDKAYIALKEAYNKVEYWTKQVQQIILPHGLIKINKRPTNQANNFDGYLWSKLYPTLKDLEEEWLAFTLGLDENFNYIVKIDTVGLKNGDKLDYYVNKRGDFHNSPLVKIIKYDDHKVKDWQGLIDFTVNSINDLMDDYNFIKKHFSINDIKNDEPNMDIKFPLNQILYGPPGTGKTFELQNTHFDNFTIRETALTREQYLESVVADLTWWQVISIAVLDLGKTKVNDIVNHELTKIKEKLSSSKTVRPTIWGQLQSHTVMECPFVNVSNRSEPLYFSKSEDSKWTIDEKLLDDYYPEAKNILAISKNYKPSNDTLIKNYDFVTFHQSFSYEDFVEGIKPRLDEGETEVAFEIKDGIFKKLCIKAEADPKNKYAIFMDEINRGNVSAIFGELITLIEDDKRLGSTNELKVKLPYSKRELGVPSNLYIIGTMNTADRSVEALDTALRRRFSFSEIMPNPELLEEIQFNSFNLSEVLKTINERIELLLDRDHTIGHSYFLKVKDGDIESLNSVFKNNIFPLLQEYFYHDYEKIALILGEGFVRIKENQTVKFAKFNDITTPDIATQFELIDKIEDIEAAVHLLLNRNV